MAWTTPKTWATDEVLTAADLNTYLRDNLVYLSGMVDAILAAPDTLTISMSTCVSAPTATSYTDCIGPSLKIIPANVADGVEVYFECGLSISNSGATASARITLDGSAVAGSEVTRTGATTVAVVRSGDLAAQFTGESLVELEVQAKTSSGSYNVGVYNPHLIIQKV